MNSLLEEAWCSELLLSLGVITLYIKLTQDFSVTGTAYFLPSCWQIPTSLLRMAAKSFMWSIRLSFTSILISNTEFQFSFLLWFHQNKHTSKPKIIVLIQAQNYCSRNTCHYVEETSLQKRTTFWLRVRSKLKKDGWRFDFKEELTTSLPLHWGREVCMAVLWGTWVTIRASWFSGAELITEIQWT